VELADRIVASRQPSNMSDCGADYSPPLSAYREICAVCKTSACRMRGLLDAGRAA